MIMNLFPELTNKFTYYYFSSVDVLTRNVSYELTAVSKKPRIKTEDNPAYVSSSNVARVLLSQEEVDLGVGGQEYETIGVPNCDLL